MHVLALNYRRLYKPPAYYRAPLSYLTAVRCISLPTTVSLTSYLTSTPPQVMTSITALSWGDAGSFLRTSVRSATRQASEYIRRILLHLIPGTSTVQSVPTQSLRLTELPTLSSEKER